MLLSYHYLFVSNAASWVQCISRGLTVCAGISGIPAYRHRNRSRTRNPCSGVSPSCSGPEKQTSFPQAPTRRSLSTICGPSDAQDGTRSAPLLLDFGIRNRALYCPIPHREILPALHSVLFTLRTVTVCFHAACHAAGGPPLGREAPQITRWRRFGTSGGLR